MDPDKVEKLSKARGGILADAYITARDRRDDLMKLVRHEELRMEMLSLIIRRKLKRETQDGFRARGLTVYTYGLRTARVLNRDEFLNFVKENDAYDLMEARASKEACQRFAAEPSGELDENGEPIPKGPPPGVELAEIEKLGVRKGK